METALLAKIRRTRICGWRPLACVAGISLLASTVHGQDEEDWTRHFRLGMLVGFNIKADFKISNAFEVSGSKPGIYDDGYVLPNPEAEDTFTSNWGYDNASQYDGANTLLMHQTTSFTPTSGGNGSADDTPYIGLDLAYGGYLWRWGRTRIGWEFGFGFLPINIQDDHPVSGKIRRSIYSFNTGGIVVPGPGYQGGPSGQGPNIDSTPTFVGEDDPQDAEITGSRTIDATLFAFRLGPSFYWDITEKIGASAGIGPALGFISGEYRFDETISYSDGPTESSTENKGSIGMSDVVYGGYINGTLMYHAEEHGDYYLSAQYMPLGSSSVSGQGHQAKLDLSGAIYLSAGINWPF